MRLKLHPTAIHCVFSQALTRYNKYFFIKWKWIFVFESKFFQNSEVSEK